MNYSADGPRADDQALAARMPHTFNIGLLKHCLQHVERDGEAVDVLKPELVEWLQTHANEGWRFIQTVTQKTVTDPETGEEVEANAVRYFLRFRKKDDAFHCMMRWHGEQEAT